MTEKNDSTKDNYDPNCRGFVKKTGLVVGAEAGGSLLGGLFTNQYGLVIFNLSVSD